MVRTEIQANSGSVRQVGTGNFHRPAPFSMEGVARNGERGGVAHLGIEVGFFEFSTFQLRECRHQGIYNSK